MLLLAVLHRSLRRPAPRIVSRPQPPEPIAISPSILPASRPQAYPALKLMAEKKRTTPAEIIHVAKVGLISSSPMLVVLAPRSFLT